MATLRERRPNVWEVRIITGTDAHGRPTQLSKTVRGGEREAQRVAAEIEAGSARAAPVRSLKKDPIVKVSVARLSVGDVERWHTRLRQGGMGDAGVKNQHGCCGPRSRKRSAGAG